jgi:hypothetical protein
MNHFCSITLGWPGGKHRIWCHTTLNSTWSDNIFSLVSMDQSQCSLRLSSVLFNPTLFFMLNTNAPAKWVMQSEFDRVKPLIIYQCCLLASLLCITLTHSMFRKWLDVCTLQEKQKLARGCKLSNFHRTDSANKSYVNFRWPTTGRRKLLR